MESFHELHHSADVDLHAVLDNDKNTLVARYGDNAMAMVSGFSILYDDSSNTGRSAAVWGGRDAHSVMRVYFGDWLSVAFNRIDGPPGPSFEQRWAVKLIRDARNLFVAHGFPSFATAFAHASFRTTLLLLDHAVAEALERGRLDAVEAMAFSSLAPEEQVLLWWTRSDFRDPIYRSKVGTVNGQPSRARRAQQVEAPTAIPYVDISFVLDGRKVRALQTARTRAHDRLEARASADRRTRQQRNTSGPACV
jgi:hypothetical protein